MPERNTKYHVARPVSQAFAAEWGPCPLTCCVSGVTLEPSQRGHVAIGISPHRPVSMLPCLLSCLRAFIHACPLAFTDACMCVRMHALVLVLSCMLA
eukprot:11987537-Alexandrium_andersonii.AAC.1